MSTTATRRLHIALWLLATLAALAGALFCAFQWLGHALGFLRSDNAVLMRGAGSWAFATLLCLFVCFRCAMRFADSGKYD
ncbi:hypothetical protein JRI60_06100 [Archangium violaceum]|uniref:hypothetical protein n=1 Tax=Archangium violaceum TaxID=83451 RepID=UPI00194E27F4|nr:hypothetical protein [Archangium violaceum]QRN98615.1 hypothetical protein JRI60_06100 [Archangium violaceum]